MSIDAEGIHGSTPISDAVILNYSFSKQQIELREHVSQICRREIDDFGKFDAANMLTIIRNLEIHKIASDEQTLAGNICVIFEALGYSSLEVANIAVVETLRSAFIEGNCGQHQTYALGIHSNSRSSLLIPSGHKKNPSYFKF